MRTLHPELNIYIIKPRRASCGLWLVLYIHIHICMYCTVKYILSAKRGRVELGCWMCNYTAYMYCTYVMAAGIPPGGLLWLGSGNIIIYYVYT